MENNEDTGSKKTSGDRGFTFPFGDFKDISKMMSKCCENMQDILLLQLLPQPAFTAREDRISPQVSGQTNKIAENRT